MDKKKRSNKQISSRRRKRRFCGNQYHLKSDASSEPVVQSICSGDNVPTTALGVDLNVTGQQQLQLQMVTLYC